MMSLFQEASKHLKLNARSWKKRIEGPRTFLAWKSRGFPTPVPQAIKWSVLQRYGVMSGTWVETGTFLGDTTALLATGATHVYSIEPSPTLAKRARERFSAVSNVTIVEGTSEECLRDVLAEVSSPVSFWLDGHFSAGITFQGPTDTPIEFELEVIEGILPHLEQAVVLVDDVRCFDPSTPEFSSYPSRGWLVQWAESHHLSWTIEYDIFVAWK